MKAASPRISSAALGRRGTAAMELALVAPVLLTFCICVADFSFVYHNQLQLSAALAAGAQFAFSAGQTESGATLPADVVNFVQAVSPVPLSSTSASYNNGLSATSSYCVKGYPAVFTGPFASGTACTDGSGSTAGRYVSISASFTYTAVFQPDQIFFSRPITQTVLTRLQ